MDAQEIVQTKEQILRQVTEFLLSRTEVIGLFCGGSIAEGTTDEYSDIDFRVVVRSECFDDFVKDHMSYPRHWGDFICNNGGRNVSVSHFKPFNKVDVLYYRPEDLKPSPWSGLPIKVLYDPDAIIERLIQSSGNLTFAPTPEQVGDSISVAIGNAHEVYRRAQRGELAYAQAILNCLRSSIVDADDALGGRPVQGEFGFSHLERRCSPQVLHALYASYVGADRPSILDALANLARIYTRQLKALYRAYDLRRNLENDLYALSIVAQQEPLPLHEE